MKKNALVKTCIDNDDNVSIMSPHSGNFGSKDLLVTLEINKFKNSSR